MNLTIDDILKNSYVISIDPNRFCRFKEIFLRNGITNIPSLYKGFKLKPGTYYGCTLKQPSILCCLTHLSIIKLAQINNLPFVCIFEDDAFPIKNIISEMNNVLHDTPDDIDVMKLGWTVMRDKEYRTYSDKLLVNTNTFGAHAYVVFKKYYNSYVDQFEIDPGSDTLVLNNKNKKIYTTKENLFIQYNYQEDNQIHNLKSINFIKEHGINVNNYDFNILNK